MASVSVSGIEETANEIQGVNSILQSTATSTSIASDTISKLATEFASYNNQVVAENTPHTVGYKSINSVDYYEEYDTWVTTTGGLENRSAALASKAEEINSVVDRINSKVADVQTIAVALQGYIDTIQRVLSNGSVAAGISSTAISSAFLALGRDGVTKANLATSGADINSRNFLDYTSIKDDEKLSSGLLSFEKQDDGSYLIKKNGESTGYYTTGLAAGLYMKTLETAVGKDYVVDQAKKLKNSVDTMNNIQENKNQISQEKSDYDFNKHQVISSITDDVKNINDISYIVDHKQDIVVPKGQHLYINGEKTIGTDYVFRYNTETNKYHMVRSDGKFSYTSYTLYEMSKAVIK